jgi:hypothetical protein
MKKVFLDTNILMDFIEKSIVNGNRKNAIV